LSHCTDAARTNGLSRTMCAKFVKRPQFSCISSDMGSIFVDMKVDQQVGVRTSLPETIPPWGRLDMSSPGMYARGAT